MFVKPVLITNHNCHELTACRDIYCIILILVIYNILARLKRLLGSQYIFSCYAITVCLDILITSVYFKIIYLRLTTVKYQKMSDARLGTEMHEIKTVESRAG